MFVTPDGHSIMKMIELHFPYHILNGRYSEEQYKRYGGIAPKLVIPFWLCSILSMLICVFIACLLINKVGEYIVGHHYSEAHIVKDLNVFMVVYCFMFSIGINLVIAPLLVLRARYGNEYTAVIDFFSFESKIDFRKAYHRFSLPLVGISLLFFVYDLTNYVLISKEKVYVKQYYTLPKTILHRDIINMMRDYETSNGQTDTSYYVISKSGDTLLLPGCGIKEYKLIVNYADTTK
ncbi:hypothetical protein [Flavipsychrobacter stenotrophus]|nr:hypothetical protein [Flavipsychrobacter stenotrophus]